MKHLYQLLFILCFTSASQAQVNTYLNNNPCWLVQYFYITTTGCATVTTYNYYLNGDTIIGAFQYKKVYKKGYGKLEFWPTGPGPGPGPGNPCLTPPPTIYFGPTLAFFIRSAGKKMYVYNPPGYSGDTLLYDFNLNVGDTLPATYNNPGSPNSSFIVSSIDSINTFNGWMKRFNLNGFYLIEGMGYKTGLIETMPPLLCGCGWNLLCYSQNNTTPYYTPNNTSSCFLTTGVNENASLKKPVVYPNPSEGKYSVYSDESYLNAKLEVFNIHGQLILSITSQNQNTEIDLKEEPAGIYFLRRTQENSSSCFKLIKH